MISSVVRLLSSSILSVPSFRKILFIKSFLSHITSSPPLHRQLLVMVGLSTFPQQFTMQAPLPSPSASFCPPKVSFQHMSSRRNRLPRRTGSRTLHRCYPIQCSYSPPSLITFRSHRDPLVETFRTTSHQSIAKPYTSGPLQPPQITANQL